MKNDNVGSKSSATLSTFLVIYILGVDLSAVQEFPFIGNYIIRLDFERDIIPKLLYLKDLGVYDHNLGMVLTTNPFILEDPINKLQVSKRIEIRKTVKL